MRFLLVKFPDWCKTIWQGENFDPCGGEILIHNDIYDDAEEFPHAQENRIVEVYRSLTDEDKEKFRAETMVRQVAIDPYTLAVDTTWGGVAMSLAEYDRDFNLVS
jgi:hypothetical protein